MKINKYYNLKIKELIIAHSKSWVVPLKKYENIYLYNYIFEFTKSYKNLSLSERVYWTLNDLHEYPTCDNPYCNNKITKAKCLPINGYIQKHCCSKCALSDPKVQNAIKEKNLRNFGFERPLLLPIYKKMMSEKMKNKTFKEKADSLKLRINTCREKYGVDNVSLTNEHKICVSKTWKLKTKEDKSDIIQRRKDTKKEVYGNENYVNADKIRLTKSNLTELQNSIINMKREKTCIRLYGVTNVLKNLAIREKLICTKHIIDRTKTFNERIIVDRYVEPLFSIDHFILHRNELLQWKCKKCGKIFSQEIGFYLMKDGRVARCLDCYPLNPKDSYAEKEIEIFIKTFYNGEIRKNDRTIISPKELDLYLPLCNVAIEYNGLFWHSSAVNAERSYHLQKTNMCEEKGIHLIHIFENEWLYERSKIEMILKSAIKGNLDDLIKLAKKKCKEKNIIKLDRRFICNNINIEGFKLIKIELPKAYYFKLFYDRTKFYSYNLYLQMKKYDTKIYRIYDCGNLVFKKY